MGASQVFLGSRGDIRTGVLSVRRAAILSLLLPVVAAACASGAAPAPAPSPVAPDAGPATMPQRTVGLIVRGEPPSIAARPLVPFSGSLDPPKRLFNGMLDLIDEKEVSHPYLAEALPQLNTDTWRLFPDGRMETTHRLRPNLTWHDGTPLTAEDFVFGWQVYATPELGSAGALPIRQMAEVVAADPRTVVIRWRQPYPNADRMDVEFQALPRHILEQPFRQGDPAAFISLPFWTVEYVGLGPYRIERWEVGAFVEATAFDGHALGRPKIDRLRLSFIADANTALANLLSGDAHYLDVFVLGYEEGLTLEREWAARGGGTVFYAPVLLRLSQVQHRPEYVSPKALLDVRVRAALAHAIDVPGALDVFTGGRGVATSSLTAPGTQYYPAVERVITKREYNPRRAQLLLEETGMTRRPDGFYASATGEPLKLEVWHTGGAASDKENDVLVDSLRQVGVDASGHALGPARLRDAEFRALRPGLFTGGAADLDQRLAQHSSSEIPRPENRWQGNNRGGWQNAEYDRLWQAYNTTLERSERIQQLAQMERALNEDVGTIPHFFTVVVTAHSARLKGPVARMVPDAPLTIYHVQTWTWVS